MVGESNHSSMLQRVDGECPDVEVSEWNTTLQCLLDMGTKVSTIMMTNLMMRLGSENSEKELDPVVEKFDTYCNGNRTAS